MASESASRDRSRSPRRPQEFLEEVGDQSLTREENPMPDAQPPKAMLARSVTLAGSGPEVMPVQGACGATGDASTYLMEEGVGEEDEQHSFEECEQRSGEVEDIFAGPDPDEEYELACPWSWRRRADESEAEGNYAFEAVKAGSGNLICKLSGIGPYSCGSDLHDKITQADGIPRTGKRLLLDTTEIAVYSRLGELASKTNVLTVLYEPLVSRLRSEDSAVREKATWAIKDTPFEELKAIVLEEVCEVLVEILNSSLAQTRETSGTLAAIAAILDFGKHTVAEVHTADAQEDECPDNPYTILLERLGAVEALDNLLRRGNPAICDAAWDIKHDHFGEPSYAGYAGGMTPDAITD